MGRHLERAIEDLMCSLVSLGARVEENVRLSLQAFSEGDEKTADQVILSDRAIDMTEIDIEEECLKILALHQPVAVDLRYIVAALKINNDLERIGDLAVDISKHALKRIDNFRSGKEFDFSLMFEKVRAMFKDSLDGIVSLDVKLAERVMIADDEVDLLHRQNTQNVLEAIKQMPDMSDELIQNLHVSQRLERIADLATNIAEDIVYLIQGDIVRHGIHLDRDDS